MDLGCGRGGCCSVGGGWRGVGSAAARIQTGAAITRGDRYASGGLPAPAQIVQQQVAVARPTPHPVSEADRSVPPPPPQLDAGSKMANARELRARGDLAAAELADASVLKHLGGLSEAQKHQVRGEYYLLQHDPRAVSEFEALVNLQPADAATLGDLAQAYCDLGDLSRALATVQKALQLDPRNPELRHGIARYAFYAGDFDRSVSESRALVRSNPSFERGYVSLALAQLGHGAHVPAINTGHQLEALSPSGKSMAAALFADVAMFDGRYQDTAQRCRMLLSPMILPRTITVRQTR